MFNRNKRIAALLVFLVALVGVTSWLLSKSSSQIPSNDSNPSGAGGAEVSASASPQARSSEAGQESAISAVPSPTAAPVAAASPSKDAAEGALHVPSQKAIRGEIERNPHGTPPSIIEFGQSLARRLEEAKQSPEQGKLFFEQVEVCALGKSPSGEPLDAPNSVLALCALKAQQLSRVFPEDFQERYNDLQQQLTPQVRQLISAFSQLGK